MQLCRPFEVAILEQENVRVPRQSFERMPAGTVAVGPHHDAHAGQLLGQFYFSELRTEQQLGYIVTMTNRTFKDQGGMAFIVQSPVASAARIETATLEFMQKQLPLLAELSEETFAQHKASLIGNLTERDKNLGDRSRRYWADLSAGVTTFDSQARIADLVGDLSKAEMIDYVRGVIERLNSARVLIFSRGRFEEVPTRGLPPRRQATSSR